MEILAALVGNNGMKIATPQYPAGQFALGPASQGWGRETPELHANLDSGSRAAQLEMHPTAAVARTWATRGIVGQRLEKLDRGQK